MLPVQKIGSEDDLKLSFQRMIDQENEDRSRLADVIPAYKKQAASAANYIYKLRTRK